MTARDECELTLTRGELRTAFAEVLDDRRTIDEKTHRSHHEYVSDRIEDHRRRRAFRDKIWAQVGGWIVIVVLSGLGIAVWAWMKAMIKKGGG